LGRLADSYIRRGHLVPDEVTVGMVKARLLQADCAAGAVLDGFRALRRRAAALDALGRRAGGAVLVVVLLTVDEGALIERLKRSARVPGKRHIYHEVANPPKTPGVCDVDGSELTSETTIAGRR